MSEGGFSRMQFSGASGSEYSVDAAWSQISSAMSGLSGGSSRVSVGSLTTGSGPSS